MADILQKQKNNLYGVVSSQLHVHVVDWYVFSDVLLDPLEQLSIDRGWLTNGIQYPNGARLGSVQW